MSHDAQSGSAPGQAELVAAGVGIAQEATAAEVISTLTHAGVRSILLKGPTVSRWLYPAVTDRYSVDVDVLVAPTEVAAAVRALSSIGFELTEPVRPDRHAYTLARPGDAIDVDLHRTLVGLGAGDGDAWAILSSRTEQLLVGGVSVEMLAEPGRTLHLALHAAQEIPDKSKALRDLERGLELIPFAAWSAASSIATQLVAEPAFAAGLRLCERGSRLAESLGLTDGLTAEAALRAGTPPDLSLGLNTMLGLHGRRRATFAIRRAFPPPEAMRLRSGLARRGRAGLAVAYISRVAWIAVRLGPAIAAVRRARTEERRANSR